jgi:hypothetical protein
MPRKTTALRQCRPRQTFYSCTGMKSATGERPQIPSRVLDAAAAHAFRLRRRVLTDDLLLLGLLELDPHQPARRALEGEGITTQHLLKKILTPGDESAEIPPALTYSPASYIVQGRVEAFAAALGEGTITPEHVLLALLWDPVSNSSWLLWKLDASRKGVIERLRALGVLVPSAPLPRQRPIAWGDRVWVDREEAPAVVNYLRLHLTPTVQWGFNYEGERAWVMAEESVDLPKLIDTARGK